jgi:Tol biopolymer transport system component/DNA-binding winged helix-turn-helix (wHTH) protein
MHERLPKTYTFAGFTLDADRSCLTRDGQDIKLRPKSFDSLRYLIENRGRVVSKDELVHAVWPDSFVTDDSLVQCVRDIRRALEDNGQDYVKTVPRRGYIFDAEVRVNENGRGATGSIEIEEEIVGSEAGDQRQGVAPSGIPAVQSAPQTRRSRPQKLWLWIAAAVLVAVGGTSRWYFRSKTAPPMWRPVPLTSYPGFESNGALSPDGNQVAFSWSGEKQDNFDIYIKLIGPGEPLRLTKNPAEDGSPAWSPDGRTIAFLRWLGGGRNELRLIPALGGPERKLADTLIVDYLGSRLPIAWSPDGHWLAVSHREQEDAAEGLFLVSALTGEKRRLTQSPQGFRGDVMPAFSPDGRTLAFSRLHGNAASEVYLLPLSRDFKLAGEVRRLTRDNLWAANPVWTPDGRRILYVCAGYGGYGRSEVRMINVSGSGRPEQVPLLEDSLAGQLNLGRHLVYTRTTGDRNIWRAEIPPEGSPASLPQPLISSTYQDGQPRYSPDGKKIAFRSNRSGSGEIWIADANGSNLVQLTSFGGPLVGLMNWSPNSQQLVFHARPEGQADLFTIPATGGVPKRLTTHATDDTVPSYSHDGRWIYFTSMRSGQFEVWKMPADGGEATQMTWGGGLRPLESPDGKTVYYARLSAREGVWKVPAQGGEEARVTGALSDQPSFAVVNDGIFYSAASDSLHQGLIQFLSFSTGRSRPVVVTDRPIGWGLSLSPDQRFVIFTQVDQTGSDLMLVENFVAP